MAITYTVEPCERKEIRDFIEKWHYSHNINGLLSQYCFKLMDGDAMVGAMIYGGLGMANCWKKYAENKEDIYGHRGVIYQASNFKHLGKTAKGRVIMWNGKRYHDKTIRTKYKGELKPFAKRVKEALEKGEAYYEETKGKEIYLYDLEGRR